MLGSTWIIAGCGGVGYCLVPRLRVAIRRYCPKMVWLVDPDHVSRSNLSRQWPGQRVGTPKAEALLQDLYGTLHPISLTKGFPGYECRIGNTELIAVSGTIEKSWDLVTRDADDLLVISMVDNDTTRLFLRDSLLRPVRPDSGGHSMMIVVGCDAEKGQSLPGSYSAGKSYYDWLETHPDVGEPEVNPSPACQIQTATANALTAALLAQHIDFLSEWIRGTPIPEYYWSLSPREKFSGHTIFMETSKHGVPTVPNTFPPEHPRPEEDEVGEDEDAQCPNCSALLEASEDTLETSEGVTACDECTGACGSCAETYLLANLLQNDAGDDLCDGCSLCPTCGYNCGGDTLDLPGPNNSPVCDECATGCSVCGVVHLRTDLVDGMCAECVELAATAEAADDQGERVNQ